MIVIKLKRLMSLLIVFTMIMSVFTALPFEVSAVTTDSESVGAEVDSDSVSYTYNGYEYKYVSSTSVEITDYTGSETELVIPSKINGLTVTKIGNSAFYNNDYLISITIPDTVTVIGACAFEYCDKLEEVVIPETVQTIGDDAFLFAKALKSIVIPDSVTSVGEFLFCGCKNLESVKLSANITSLGSNFFSSCESLTEVIMPENILSMDSFIFTSCESLKSIELPSKLITIDRLTFWGCGGVTEIKVNDNNPYFTDIDGVLFDKKCETLIRCPSGKVAESLCFPEGVKKIADYAFKECIGIKSIVIPEGVTYIGGYVFDECSGLVELTLPESLKTINGVISDCSNLRTVNYNAISCNNRIFQDCYAIRYVNIGDKVKCIPDRFIESSTSLTTLTIPESVTSIGKDAFYNCKNLNVVKYNPVNCAVTDRVFYKCNRLENIAIGKKVESVSTNLLYGCTALKQIAANNKNVNYSSVGGVLFDENYETLIKYPCKKADTEYKIPDSVKEIECRAFEYSKNLDKIIMTEFVENIKTDAFSNCSNLTIYAPKNSYAYTYANKNSIPFVSYAENFTLKFAAPTSSINRFNWSEPVFYYGSSNVVSENKMITMTETDEIYYKSGCKNSELITAGGWKIYEVKIPGDLFNTIQKSTYVGFATSDSVNRTYGNVLKAKVDVYGDYSKIPSELDDIYKCVFVIEDSVKAKAHTTYIGYWVSDYATVRFAAPIAKSNVSTWDKVEFYYNDSSVEMINTYETTKVSDVGDMTTLKTGRWYIYALTLDSVEVAKANKAKKVGFAKVGADNTTSKSKNVLYAKTNEFDGEYNYYKRTLQKLDGQVFVVQGKATETSLKVFIGEWQTEEKYKADNDDKVKIYFAAPKGISESASWDTGVELYYGNTTQYKDTQRIAMKKTANKVITADTKGTNLTTLVSGVWDVYYVELTKKQVSIINECDNVGFIKSGSYNRTSILQPKNITRASTTKGDAKYISKKNCIEALDGYTFVINGMYDSKNERTSYLGSWIAYW